jgi:hypothetical protein
VREAEPTLVGVLRMLSDAAAAPERRAPTGADRFLTVPVPRSPARRIHLPRTSTATLSHPRGGARGRSRVQPDSPDEGDFGVQSLPREGQSETIGPHRRKVELDAPATAQTRDRVPVHSTAYQVGGGW